jgi:hypothetical protein
MGTDNMQKRKNSIEGNLLTSSWLYGILIAALGLGLLFLYLGLFFSVLTISAITGAFALVTHVQLGLFIAACHIIFIFFNRSRRGRWAEQALDVEEARVLRLMEDTSGFEDIVSLDELLYAEKKRGMP